MDNPEHPLPSQQGPNFDVDLGASGAAPSVRKFNYGEYYQLHPNVKKRWLIGVILSALFALPILAGVIFFTTRFLEWRAEIVLLVGISLWVLFLTIGLLMISFEYKRWRYRISRDEFTAERGVIVWQKTTVPRLRIQHVDINSGPIDRMFGLVELSLYTAGAMGAIVTVPGLTPDDAEALRKDLLHLK
jgi:membrane protein YdbS with pleckstrin-like domain